MQIYDQTKDAYLRNSCPLMTLWHIMEFKFWITVVPNFIMKTAQYFDKLWKWFPSQWAVFDVIYNAFVDEMNKKLWLKFEVIKSNVYKLSDLDTWSYWIWACKYSKAWYESEDKGEMTKEDVDKIVAYTGKTFNHNICWDWSKWWYFINSRWKKPFKCSIDTLKYLADKWIIWSPTRTIKPADEFTTKIVDLTLELRWLEKRWKLESFFAIHWINEYTEKARVLYYYWREDLIKQ